LKSFTPARHDAIQHIPNCSQRKQTHSTVAISWAENAWKVLLFSILHATTCPHILTFNQDDDTVKKKMGREEDHLKSFIPARHDGSTHVQIQANLQRKIP
jgi:hypothetical protein